MPPEVVIGPVRVGGGAPLALIAGPCVIEGEAHLLELGGRIAEICRAARVPFILKASFDKANRTSHRSARGPGLAEGLRILGRARRELGVPVLSDVHETGQVAAAAEVLDVLQIPAFLCRQTDLLMAAGASGRAVNVKKAQFVAPEDMAHALEKLRAAGGERILLTERGTTFGYHNLVVDMRGLVRMRSLGVPVVFDGTHSVQLPGGAGAASGGERAYIAPLVRAAVAVGVDALFLEVHEAPERALSDGASLLPLAALPGLLQEATAIAALRPDSRAPRGGAGGPGGTP